MDVNNICPPIETPVIVDVLLIQIHNIKVLHYELNTPLKYSSHIL